MNQRRRTRRLTADLAIARRDQQPLRVSTEGPVQWLRADVLRVASATATRLAKVGEKASDNSTAIFAQPLSNVIRRFLCFNLAIACRGWQRTAGWGGWRYGLPWAPTLTGLMR
jgi:hypothetical protein